MAVIWTIYIIILKITDTKINLSEVIGYSISLNNQLIMDLIYIGILVFLLLVCKINFNKNYINKIGMNYTMGTIMIIIFEMILKILKVEIFPYSLIGTVVVLWLSIYSYDSFKKNN
ncbi:hypothetical protein [Clostridium fallax]|nr:hypothetical protein [Clostridium fallax]